MSFIFDVNEIDNTKNEILILYISRGKFCIKLSRKYGMHNLYLNGSLFRHFSTGQNTDNKYYEIVFDYVSPSWKEGDKILLEEIDPRSLNMRHIS